MCLKYTEYFIPVLETAKKLSKSTFYGEKCPDFDPKKRFCTRLVLPRFTLTQEFRFASARELSRDPSRKIGVKYALLAPFITV